jgi:hypothetical protein
LLGTKKDTQLATNSGFIIKLRRKETKMSIKDMINEENKKIQAQKELEKRIRETEKRIDEEQKAKLEEKRANLLKELKKIPGIKVKDNQINVNDTILELKIEYNHWEFQGSDESPVEKRSGWQISYSNINQNTERESFSLNHFDEFEKYLAHKISGLMNK